MRNVRIRGSRTLSLCTTTAGLRLSARIHQTSPLAGSCSPLIAGVLLAHPASLIVTPRLARFGDVPAVAVDVGTDLPAQPFGFEQLGNQPGPGRAAPLGFRIGEPDEIVRQRDSQLHAKKSNTMV